LHSILRIHFDEALRVIEHQDAILALESFTVTDQDILVPVIQRISKDQGEGKVLGRRHSLSGRLDRDKLEPALPVRVSE